MKIANLKGSDKEAKRVDWHYKNKEVAKDYIAGRFSNPLGIFHHKKQIRFANKIIRNYRTKKLLDLACGPARVGADLRGFKEAYGVDVSQEMLKVAKRRIKSKQWKFSVQSAFNLKFRPEFFDIVVSLRFIRHLKEDRRKRAYKQIRKVLKKNGLFILDAVNYDRDYKIRKRKGFHKYKIYDKLYKKKELVKELENNGFRVLATENIFNSIYISAAISKVFFVLSLGELGSRIIDVVERIKTRDPLEWIVLCQKK